jgi:proline iminopeptidase
MKEGSTSSPNWPAATWLEVGSGHRLWWCEGGDRRGRPVLVLHGGPGGASRPETVRWFDGLPVRWIVFDQRGCGRSTPAGSTVDNDLAALVADAEALRAHLGIERWALVGGSWGARVALACAAAQPGRIDGLFLRSPFLASQAEAARYAADWDAWLGEAGKTWLGPARCSAFRRLFQDETSDAVTLSTVDDPAIARAWSAYDDAQSAPGGVAASSARFAIERLPAAGDDLRASWRVHAHYAANGWGAGMRPAVWSLDAVAPKPLAEPGPVSVVWGEADATCDPQVAWALAGHWPSARARGVPGAGHRMGDPRLGPVLAEEIGAWVGRLG